MKPLLKALLIITFFSFGIIFLKKHQNNEDEKFDQLPVVYTVAKIYDIDYPAQGNPVLRYEYSINGNKYQNNVKVLSASDVNIQDQYLVKVLRGDLKNSRILLGYSIKKKIIPPENGWMDMPSIE